MILLIGYTKMIMMRDSKIILDESDNDDSFGTIEEYIRTSQVIEAVDVLLSFWEQENFDFIDVLNLREKRTDKGSYFKLKKQKLIPN